MEHKPNLSTTRLIALLGIVAVIVALVMGVAGCGTSTVSVAEVTQKPLPIQLEADANATALNKATIQPAVGGQVAQFMVKVGDKVTQGQTVAVLDTTAAQSQLSALEQKLAEAESSGGGTTTTTTTSAPTVTAEQVALAEELRASGNITQKQYDSIIARSHGTTTTTTVANGGGGNASVIAGIQASIAKVQDEINSSQIVAPIAGTVTNIYNEDRKIAVQGRPFMLIQQSTPIVASLSLPRDIAMALASDEGKKDLQVFLTVDNDTIPGQVTYIDTTQPEGTPTVLVKATFNNENGAIQPGEFYSMHIESSATAPMLTVPEKAVRENKDGHYVYIVTDDNAVDVRAVQVGETVDGETAILSGINEGERVITTDGLFELGQHVEIND